MEIKEKKKEIDFTSGPIMRQILVFGLPILLGSILQQMYNLVDSIVVGNFVGTEALAAVGSAATISNCLIGITTGLTIGANVIISQLIGAKRTDEIKKALSTTIIFSVAVAIVLTIIGVTLAPSIMRWVRVPDEVMDDSVAYMVIYSAGCVFMMLYNYFASALRALGDSRTPLIFLAIATVLNIAGDLFFVIVLNMGVRGVAIATVAAQAVSVLLCVVYCRKKNEFFRFSRGEFVFNKTVFRSVVRLGVPSAIQFGAGSLGFILVQGLINSFGTSYMAAYTATSKLEGIAHLPIECFSMALAVFVGQNIGANNLERIKKALVRVMAAMCLICGVIAILVYAIGPQLISLFVADGHSEVIEIGTEFLRVWAPFTFVFAIMNAFTSVLRGAGDSIFVMLEAFLDIGGRTVSAYLIVLVFNSGYIGIAYAMVCGWTFSLIETGIRYFTGGWKNKSVVK